MDHELPPISSSQMFDPPSSKWFIERRMLKATLFVVCLFVGIVGVIAGTIWFCLSRPGLGMIFAIVVAATGAAGLVAAQKLNPAATKRALEAQLQIPKRKRDGLSDNSP